MKNGRRAPVSPVALLRFLLVRLAAAGLVLTATVAIPVTSTASAASDQTEHLDSVDQGIIQQMLKDVADTVKKKYYDPKFQGADLNASFRAAEEAIRTADSVHQGYEAVASFTESLQDSHTRFLPPQQPFTIEQGWQMQMVGDKCFVTHVKEDSDAAAKGLKAGDQIARVDGVEPTREDWQKLQYALRILSPRSSLHLVVIRPGQQPQTLVVANKVTKRRVEYDLTTNDIWWLHHQDEADWHRFEPRSVALDNVMAWKLPVFRLKEADIDGCFHKAGKYPALVIDLRGNPGGLTDLLQYMLGWVFEHDVKIADAVGRDKTKTLQAKGRGSHAYSGKIIVLIDSQSSSASELFARVIQLEKRGVVIGDRSSGEVRLAEAYPFIHGQHEWHEYAYGVEVTVADLKMADGASLENVGVTPDEIVLPTPAGLAGAGDPQLARALQLAGNPVSAEKAGTLFPPLWQ